MPRSYKSPDRNLVADPIYGNKLVSKFINCLMRNGKKSIAQAIFYAAMEHVKKKLPDRPTLEVFTLAINNVKPVVEVRSKRVGGANYQVPKDVGPKRQQALAIRWILEAVRSKKGRPTHIKLADEIMAAFRKEGARWSWSYQHRCER